MQIAGLQWLLELALIGLLAVTLFHAMRLERALGMLKRDRAALEELVRGFNASTRQAETGVELLRDAVDGAGRQIARQIEAAGGLKQDLVFLNERGEQLADRLDGLVRSGQKQVAELPRRVEPDYARIPPDRAAPGRIGEAVASRPRAEMAEIGGPADPPRLRSQAERDLMKALRLSR